MWDNAADASIVNKHIEPPPLRRGLQYEPDPIFILSKISLHIRGCSKLCCQRMSGLDRTARVKNDREAFTGQSASNGFADA
jgi:hypothetical protein